MPDATDLFTQGPIEFELMQISLSDTLHEPFGTKSRYRSTAHVATCARNHGRLLRCLHSSFII